jgi:kumamolisin
VISISWGGPESSWTAQARTALDKALQAAAAMGVTVCIASGDSGSSDGAAGGDHVDFPASSPHALACGGTSIAAAKGAITRETVWNDGANGGASGGGVSAGFALPAWQKGLKATNAKGVGHALAKRGVPDVAGDADPETGYQVRVDGTDMVIGGTSAVAPLWAGLIARINAAKGAPVGFINAALYTHAAAFNDVTDGDNGDFAASAGWDACTGLGSPNGAAIQAALASAAVKSEKRS